MRLLSATLFATATAGILASCSGSNPSSPSASLLTKGGAPTNAGHRGAAVSIVPRSDFPKGPLRLHGRQAPAAAIKGIYVGDFGASDVLGYPKNNSNNGPAICMVQNVANVNNVATDTAGNLIVPDSVNGVNVYQGPAMCGPLLATITDAYGQASDAAAVNATTGPIVVANILGPGFVVTCTVASGTCTQLTPSSAGIGEVAGVAMDRNGNCWADGYNAAFTSVVLTYWAGCSGAGQIATGFTNSGYGGMDVDNSGNLVTLDWNGSKGTTVRVYSGCNPACASVSANPLTQDVAIFGHLGHQGQRLAVGAYTAIQVDIYAYTPTTLTYYYSFDNGLGPSGEVEGVAYSPSSQK